LPPVLSIVIPTIRGREHWLEQTLTAFAGTTKVPYEVLIELDHEVCGMAWNAGIERAQGEYVLIAADDLTPSSGWFEAGKSVVDEGSLPSALILNPDGTVQSCGDKTYRVADGTRASIARIPFASLEQMQFIAPILEIHYATDNWFSHRGRLNGWESVICTDFCFTHHFAMEGRIDERVLEDVEVFRKAAGLESAAPAAL
jgi:hypothetical protein